MNSPIIAYYCSACSPGKSGKDYHRVRIQYADQKWRVLKRFSGWPGEKDWIKMAKHILEHHRGHSISIAIAEKMYRLPGKSILRLTPGELDKFWIEHCAQQSLFSTGEGN